MGLVLSIFIFFSEVIALSSQLYEHRASQCGSPASASEMLDSHVGYHAGFAHISFFPQTGASQAELKHTTCLTLPSAGMISMCPKLQLCAF